jgi:hypothetical protein
MGLRKDLLITLVGIAVFAASFLAACGAPDSQAIDPENRIRRYLYVTSGACYGGGVALATGSNTIVAYDLTTGAIKHYIRDYNTASPGDSPVGIREFNANYFLVSVENAAGRRIDIVRKDGVEQDNYINNSAALSATMRGIFLMPDKSLLVSKASAIEKFASGKSRVTIGANPFVNAPAGVCATTNVNVSSLLALPNGKILYTHANTSPNNKTVLIGANGYTAAGDCLSSQAAPVTTSLPTASLLHSSGKLLIAYGSTTATSNSIYSYDLNQTTNAFSGATLAYTDYGIVNGPSAMAEDPVTGDVYVANATSTFNTIEKFTFNSSTGVLTRATTLPFVQNSVFSRCVTGMAVMEKSE